MENYYKNCSFIDLLKITNLIDKSFEEFEDLLYYRYGKDNLEEMYFKGTLPDKVYIKEIDSIIKPEDLLLNGLDMCFDVDINKMKMLTEFVASVGFSLNDGLSCYYTFSNFLDKDNYPHLFDITNTFSDFLNTNRDNLYLEIINELEKYGNLRYFENDTFIYIPDYSCFIDNDIFHEIPNFIYKKDGYALRFRKGIGRSSYCNLDKNIKDFDCMLYNCLLSTT